jgi:hypothetical protein
VALTIKKVSIPAGQAVGVLASLGQTVSTQVYSLDVWVPESEAELELSDSAGVPTDPEAPVPIPSLPFHVDATKDDFFIYNPGSSAVSVVMASWFRQ